MRSPRPEANECAPGGQSGGAWLDGSAQCHLSHSRRGPRARVGDLRHIREELLAKSAVAGVLGRPRSDRTPLTTAGASCHYRATRSKHQPIVHGVLENFSFPSSVSFDPRSYRVLRFMAPRRCWAREQGDALTDGLPGRRFPIRPTHRLVVVAPNPLTRCPSPLPPLVAGRSNRCEASEQNRNTETHDCAECSQP